MSSWIYKVRMTKKRRKRRRLWRKKRLEKKTFACLVWVHAKFALHTTIRPKTVKKQLKTFFVVSYTGKLMDFQRRKGSSGREDTKGDYNFFAWSICALEQPFATRCIPCVTTSYFYWNLRANKERGKWCPISILVHFRQLLEFSKVKKREQSEYVHAYIVTRKQINPNFWGCHLPLIKQRGKSWRFFPGQTFFFQPA